MLEAISDNLNGRAKKFAVISGIADDAPHTALDFMTSCFRLVDITSPQLSNGERGELVMSMIREATGKTEEIERQVGNVLYRMTLGSFATFSATLQNKALAN